MVPAAAHRYIREIETVALGAPACRRIRLADAVEQGFDAPLDPAGTRIMTDLEA